MTAKVSKATAKFGTHSVHVAWQTSKKLDYQFKIVRRRRAIYGEFRKFPDGHVEYWAVRSPEQKVRNVDNGWAIDKATLSLARAYGVTTIGVQVDDGSSYWMSYEDFMTHKVDWNYEGHVGTAPGAKGKVGESQWAVGHSHWQFKMGLPETVMKRVAIGKWG